MKRMLKLSAAFFLVLLLLNPGCKKSEDFNLNDIIMLDLIEIQIDKPLDGDNKLRADGVSRAVFKAHIDPDSKEKFITFSTTSGSFIGALNANTITVPIDDAGDAEATLRVGKKSGKVEVVVSVLNYRKSYDLDLRFAHPDKLTLESSTLFVSKSGAVKATIKAFLRRDKDRGSVSIGTKVEFDSLQLNDQNREVTVGRFLNEVSTDASGIASITFAADKSDVKLGRPVIIRVTANKDDGTPIQQEVLLTVIE